MEWTHFDTTAKDAIIGFLAGNAAWFIRQWLWQEWVKKSHAQLEQHNKIEEEKTRAEVRALREQIGHLSLGMMEQIEVDPITKQELTSVINGEEIIG